MNKTVIGLLAGLFLAACGGGGSEGSPPGGNQSDEVFNFNDPLPSASTEAGKPISNYVAQPNSAIGPAGGSFSSEDGLLTLTVPQGAVSDLTRFGIQLISNAVPGGVGLTYRVTAKEWAGNPDQDVPLLKPLELSLELRPEQLEGIAPEDLLMAYQGNDGRWQVSVPQTQAASARAAQNAGVRLKAQVRRPGDYAATVRYKIYPKQQSVRVGARLTLTALKISPAALDANSGYNLAEITAVPATAWAVQGVPGGSDALGRLLDEGKPSARVYLAPKSLPRPNPVRVTAQIADRGRTVTVASSIRVVDSQGWMEFRTIVIANRTFRDGGQLSVDAFAENALEVTNTQAIGKDIGAVFYAKPRPGGFARARVTYRLNLVEDCVCAPNEGTIRRTIDYSFIAGGEPRVVPPGESFAFAEMGSGKTYKLSLPLFNLELDGEYTYRFKEDYPCGDRPPRPEQNVTGSDTFTFSTATEHLEGLVESVGLTGILRLRGTGSLKSMATLPKKALAFADEPAVTIATWFLMYDVLEGRLQQQTPAQAQRWPLGQSPRVGLVDAAEPQHEPRMLLKASSRLAGCQGSQAPIVRRSGSAPGH